MIISITHSNELTRTLARARKFAGKDEDSLSSAWLEERGICSIPEENMSHGGTEFAPALARACRVYPDSEWRSVEFADQEHFGEALILTDPGEDLDWHVTSSGEEASLGALYGGRSFLLFSMQYPAAILYSANEFKLVSGASKFVRAYFADDLHFALDAFEEYWRTDVPAVWGLGSAERAERMYRKIYVQIRQE